MSEWDLVHVIPLRFIPIIAFAYLYAFGGRRYKWVRRIAGSTLFIGLIALLSFLLGTFSPWQLLPLLVLAPALTLGYGASGDTIKSIVKRGIYGLAVGLCGLVMGIVTNHWELGVFQLILAFVSSIYLGVINPTKAVNEEGLIATLSVVSIPFMV